MGRRPKKKASIVQGSIHNIFTILSLSYLGKILLYAIFSAIVILATAMITNNDFDRFFTALGVEVLIVTMAGWIVYLVMRKSES